MKKSSLGKRRSSIGYFGVQSVERNVQVSRTEGKRSFLPKPVFGSGQGKSLNPNSSRSSSADRTDRQPARKDPSSGIKRSKSQLNFDFGRSSTPCQTPVYKNSGTGGRVSRESGRCSSVGGVTRKETRPITEKPFQEYAQEKIEEYFSQFPNSILINGSMKPFSITMFVDMVDHLLRANDPRICITKANYMDEIPRISKLYMYRGKIDRSWLISVNTAHSWPHALAFILWLVELDHMVNSLNTYEVMYPTELIGEQDNPNDINFKILLPYLISGYNNHRKGQDDKPDMYRFLTEYKMVKEVTDEDMEQLCQQLKRAEAELAESEDQTLALEVEALEQNILMVNQDIKKYEEFLEGTEQFFIESAQHKECIAQEFSALKNSVNNLKEKIEKVRENVNNQALNQSEKEKMQLEMVKCRDEIKYYEECIQGYKETIYSEDIKITQSRAKFNKMLVEFNKDIPSYSPFLPNLKDLKVDINIFHEDAAENLRHIDKNLAQVHEKLKTDKLDALNSIKYSENLEQEAKSKFSEVVLEEKKLEEEIENCEAEIRDIKEQFENEQKKLYLFKTELENEFKMANSSDPELAEVQNKLSQMEKYSVDEDEDNKKFLKALMDFVRRKRDFHDKLKTDLEEGRVKVYERVKKMEDLLEKVKPLEKAMKNRHEELKSDPSRTK